MDKLQHICKKTRYFWSFSRVVFIGVFIYALNDFSKNNSTQFVNTIMALIFVPYILSMIYNQIIGFTKSKKITLPILISKIYVSIITFGFASLLIYLFVVEETTTYWSILLPFWMFLFAIYEFVTSQKPEEIDLSIEIDEIGQN